MQKSQVVIHGQLINYYFSDKKSDLTLIFLHGWRCEALAWQGIANKVEGDNISFYLLDLPGFGGSPAPKKPFGVGDYAEIVAGFIKKNNLNNVVLIGHSFGGRIAIKIAAENPNYLKKIILVDSAGLKTNKSLKWKKAIAKIAKPFLKPKFMLTLKEKLYQKIGAGDYTATPFHKETFLKVIGEDLTSDLEKIKISTLLVWGENDKETPLAMGKIMQKKIKNSRLEILENAGHFSFLDKPDEFFNVILRVIPKDLNYRDRDSSGVPSE